MGSQPQGLKDKEPPKVSPSPQQEHADTPTSTEPFPSSEQLTQPGSPLQPDPLAQPLNPDHLAQPAQPFDAQAALADPLALKKLSASELKAKRAELSGAIDANERAHRALVAQRRVIDQQIRDRDLAAVADFVSGPLPDLPPDTHAPAPLNAKAPRVTIFGRSLTTTTASYAFLCMTAGGFMFPLFFSVLANTLLNVAQGSFDGTNMMATVTFFVVGCICMLALGGGFILMGLRLFLDQQEGRLRLCNWLIVCVVALFIIHITIFGITSRLIVYGLMGALLVALHGYLDPELALERYNKATTTKTLRQMLRKDDVERTYVPGHRSGKGYISLNFFNLFWIFTICSVLGLIVETIWHMVVVDPGVYQDRAGMLWGPLSPIYGFGGTLMTIFLNRLHDKPLIVTFLVSALVGGAFEYFTSWFMQYAFGITAWDYSGTFLNIDGRTNFMFMCMWGFLGVVWLRLLLPIMLYFMKKIPWGWRYTLTAIFAVLVIFDGFMTLTTLDCWYLREDGVPVHGVVETFCAKHFDDQFMEHRFQSMTMNVNSAARSNERVHSSA